MIMCKLCLSESLFNIFTWPFSFQSQTLDQQSNGQFLTKLKLEMVIVK